MSEFNHDERLNSALHAIEVGGRTQVTLARQRVAKLLEAIDDGEFSEAMDHLSGIHAALEPIFRAQQSISFAAGAEVIDVKDVQVGMEVVGAGRVESVDEEIRHCGPGCPGHVTIRFANDQHVTLHLGTEVYVRHPQTEVGS